MARDYARIMTAIWNNETFLSLGEAEQRAYLLLVTQPDISAAGVLGLRVRRWAGMSSTSDPDAFARSLKLLEGSRFIVMDYDTEELLIRSFIKWDAGFNNKLRRPVIVRAREESRSEIIRASLDKEFQRYGLTSPPPPSPPTGGGSDSASPSRIDEGDAASDRASDAASNSLSGFSPVDPGLDPFPQFNSLSDAPDDAASDRASTSRAPSEGRVPQPTTHKPTTPHAADAPRPTARRNLTAVPSEPVPDPPGGVTAQTCAGAWVDAFRATGAQPADRQIKQAAREAKQLLDAGNPPDVVLDLARSAGTKRRATVVNELAARPAVSAVETDPRVTGRRIVQG